MLTSVKLQKRVGLSLIGLLVMGLMLAWILPNGPLSQPKAAVTTANDAVPALTDRFRFGTNMGHRNDNWSDSQYSDLVAGLGMNSFRVNLPENYLETWGYNIAVSNMQHYQANNLKNLTAFLNGPTRAHSNAPTSVADWELDYYSPKNLYQPIWNADGSVNQNNYWAAYVSRTVTTYKPYVKIWEIWNEPDFTDNWNATQGWMTSAPNPADLSHWNDSIYSYVRMLRVSYEVIKKADPTALVATGGLGYPGFLDAVLRYTDNPTAGAVDAASYPLKGGAYFDVLSYHYYPQYDAQNITTGAWNTNHDSDNSVDNFLTYRNNFKTLLNQRGYGTTYPAKYFIATETGHSSKPNGSTAGGMDLLKNYMMKLQVMARVNDMKQVHTYMLSDEEPDTALTDSYKHMGMYYDIAGLTSTSQASRKPASYGTETIARTLEGATYDAAATAALNLPASVRGAVFQNNGQRVTILWAKTAANVETATTNFALPATTSLTLRNWQWAQTNTTQTLNPVNGLVQLSLSGSPIILLGSNVTPPPTATATSTPVPPTATRTAAPTNTPVPPTAAPTNTPVPPTAVPTSTPVPPTATATRTATVAPPTNTPVPPTATVAPPTNTPVPPTATKTATVAPTNTPVPPTATPTKTATPPGGATPVKLAVSGVSASASNAGAAATNVVDNNTNTYWGIGNGPTSAWIRLDLGANRVVSEIKYFVYATDSAPNTKVQYSLDGTNWTTLPNANGINTGANWGWNSLNANKVTARYIRFYLDNATRANWDLGYYSEMQVWGN